jgi:hypothetical protein
VFIAGDQARYTHQNGKPLPGTAPVAMQQGRYLAGMIVRDMKGEPREPFRFVDKGQMATIGRSKAILEIGSLQLHGFPAWIAWLAVHIYYLAGFEHRLIVVLQWAWSYLTFGRGARLIIGKEWRNRNLPLRINRRGYDGAPVDQSTDQLDSRRDRCDCIAGLHCWRSFHRKLTDFTERRRFLVEGWRD